MLSTLISSKVIAIDFCDRATKYTKFRYGVKYFGKIVHFPQTNDIKLADFFAKIDLLKLSSSTLFHDNWKYEFHAISPTEVEKQSSYHKNVPKTNVTFYGQE